VKNIYENRKYVFGTLLFLVVFIFIRQTVKSSVLDKSYQTTANRNVLRYIIRYPARGLIYDRTGELLVYNEAIYDLMILPNLVEEFDTSVFCDILKITHEDVEKKLENARKYSYYTSSPFLKQVSSETYAVLQGKTLPVPVFVQPDPSENTVKKLRDMHWDMSGR